MKSINHFYTFGSKLSSSTFQANPVGLNSGRTIDSKIFDEHLLIQGAYEGIDFPVVFQHQKGTKLHDVLDTGWPSLFLISKQLVDALQTANLKGWKTFDVKVLDNKRNEIKGYYGLSVTGKCGPINYNDCEIIEKRLAPQGPLYKYFKGLYIGLDSWDKTDFFLPKDYFGIIVSKAAAEIIEKWRFSNIRLCKLSEVEIPEFVVQVK